MKRNKAVVLCAIIALLIACGVIVCVLSQTDKSARILNDDAADLVNRDFYDNNRVSGAYYDGAASDDSEYPSARTFLICSAEEYEEIFSQATVLAIDFQNSAVAVYTFADIYKREVRIKMISTSEDSITIVLAHKKAPSGTGDACTPYQRYVVIELSGNGYTDISISVED